MAAAAWGVILAGGRASRLPGKPLLELGGEPLIAHPLRAVAATGLTPAVVAKAGDGPLSEVVHRAGATLITEPDEPVHPLFGIAVALAELGGPVVVCGADMPFVAPGLLAHMARRCVPPVEVVACEAGGIVQPLLACYSPTVEPELRAAVAAQAPAIATLRAFGERFELLAPEQISPFGDPTRIAFDVDSQADLDRARTMLGRAVSGAGDSGTVPHKS